MIETQVGFSNNNNNKDLKNSVYLVASGAAGSRGFE